VPKQGQVEPELVEWGCGCDHGDAVLLLLLPLLLLQLPCDGDERPHRGHRRILHCMIRSCGRRQLQSHRIY
jgi:hypothetical protein